MLERKRRQTLSAAEVARFAQAASVRHSNTPNLTDYTWWPAADIQASDVQIDLTDGTVQVIKFKDIIADYDGVFYFGWDEGTRNAIWKWVPVFNERRDSSTAIPWVSF